MRHAFKSRRGMLGSMVSAAVLLGWALFVTVPEGHSQTATLEPPAAGHSLGDGHVAATTAKPKAKPSVPVEGFLIAVSVGIIALIVSIGPFLEPSSQRKEVRWVGPRSRV